MWQLNSSSADVFFVVNITPLINITKKRSESLNYVIFPHLINVAASSSDVLPLDGAVAMVFKGNGSNSWSGPALRGGCLSPQKRDTGGAQTDKTQIICDTRF